MFTSFRVRHLATAGLSAFLMVAGARSGAAQEGTRPGLTPMEKDFVNSWAMAMNYELAAARVAETMGRSEAVRRFASAMLADHGTIVRDVGAAVASADRTVTLPSALSVAGNERMRALQAATPETFDMTYRAQMLSSHTEAQAALAAFLESTTTNSGLRAAALNAKARIDAHLNAAKELPRRT
jgi:predicted outer membrane protein